MEPTEAKIITRDLSRRTPAPCSAPEHAAHDSDPLRLPRNHRERSHRPARYGRLADHLDRGVGLGGTGEVVLALRSFVEDGSAESLQLRGILLAAQVETDRRR